MTIRDSFKKAGQAIKVNFLPGVLLWILLVIFIITYLTTDKLTSTLMLLSDLKIRAGLIFSFFSYVISCAFLPILLQIIFFQRLKPTVENIKYFLFGALVWGFIGILVDLFYNFQSLLFGENSHWQTLTFKTIFDQFVFTPLTQFFITGMYLWFSEKFQLKTLKQIFSINFLKEYLLPVLISCWCIWIPGVLVVYSMPLELQLPIASIIMCFWVLIFTFINKKSTKNQEI